MRCALLVYHKNISSIYPAQWIARFKLSIERQTHRDFDIFEVNYGAGRERIFDNSFYESQYFLNFVSCLNYLLDKTKDYDFVFNTNVDDYYSNDRIERQLVYLNKGFDIVSSNFSLIQNGKEVYAHRFHEMDIRRELIKGHNIIGHPVVAYSKNFRDEYRYSADEIPYEDLKLWQRALKNKRFFIMPDYLLFHRLHNQMVSKPNSINR